MKPLTSLRILLKTLLITKIQLLISLKMLLVICSITKMKLLTSLKMLLVIFLITKMLPMTFLTTNNWPLRQVKTSYWMLKTKPP